MNRTCPISRRRLFSRSGVINPSRFHGCFSPQSFWGPDRWRSIRSWAKDWSSREAAHLYLAGMLVGGRAISPNTSKPAEVARLAIDESSKSQVPNSKEIPKHQFSIPSGAAGRLELAVLNFDWSLDFGFWSFSVRLCNVPMVAHPIKFARWASNWTSLHTLRALSWLQWATRGWTRATDTRARPNETLTRVYFTEPLRQINDMTPIDRAEAGAERTRYWTTNCTSGWTRSGQTRCFQPRAQPENRPAAVVVDANRRAVAPFKNGSFWPHFHAASWRAPAVLWPSSAARKRSSGLYGAWPGCSDCDLGRPFWLSFFHR